VSVPFSLAALLLALSSIPVASPAIERIVANAEQYLGEPYRWGGRNTSGNPGIDCLGILFLAYGPETGRSWREFPVDPSKIVASGMLGTPVEGLDGVLHEDLDVTKLQRGDVLYLLSEGHEIPDEPLMVRGGKRYWPWHTGLYVDEGEQLVLHAAPGGVVTRQPLDEVGFDALYVTRLTRVP
jgi:cell wall-associated NlpC family hydrolase